MPWTDGQQNMHDETQTFKAKQKLTRLTDGASKHRKRKRGGRDRQATPQAR